MEENHKPILLAILFAMICIFIIQYDLPLVWGFPTDDDVSFVDKMKQVKETDIENPRTPNAQRRASENKYPWNDKSLVDMEGIVWPDFGGRGDVSYRLGNIDPQTGQVNYYQTGCAFYQPNIIVGNLCDESVYVAHLGILQGVITGYTSTGPGTISPDGMNFYVEWEINASYGEQIIIEVSTASLEDGSEGGCKTVIQLLCGKVCIITCSSGIPLSEPECTYLGRTSTWEIYTVGTQELYYPDSDKAYSAALEALEVLKAAYPGYDVANVIDATGWCRTGSCINWEGYGGYLAQVYNIDNGFDPLWVYFYVTLYPQPDKWCDK